MGNGKWSCEKLENEKCEKWNVKNEMGKMKWGIWEFKSEKSGILKSEMKNLGSRVTHLICPGEWPPSGRSLRLTTAFIFFKDNNTAIRMRIISGWQWEVDSETYLKQPHQGKLTGRMASAVLVPANYNCTWFLSKAERYIEKN